MSWIEIDLDSGKTAYRPGEEVVGRVAWSLEASGDGTGAPLPPARAEIRLVWFTRGEGDRDSEVVDVVELPAPGALDRREFRLRVPPGPYSVVGKLVSIGWAVEAVLEPGSRAERIDIVVSPTGRPVVLHPDLAGEAAPEA